MHLYNLTLVRSGAITSVVYGSFSGPKLHELAVTSGTTVGILRPDEYGRVRVVYQTECFACVRGIVPFRLTGSKKDYIAVGSDSGKLAVLRYDEKSKRLETVHCETFGKSGCRRIVPGQYVAADPRGRALMVAALEKQKFVYVLNRDAQENLTISSPLEAHKSSMVVYSLVGLDVGFENPVFAAIESSYDGKSAQSAKILVFYELDLGLNHVTRKHMASIPDTSHLLIGVPGGGDGPGGVLVCSDGLVSFFSLEEEQSPITAKLPRRQGHTEESILISSATMHKQRGMFFLLLCTERGDLIKVDVQWEPEAGASALDLLYFDTLPGAAVSMAVMRNGFLVAASEFGEHLFFQFQGIGDRATTAQGITSSSGGKDDDKGLFEPRLEHSNLTLIDSVESSAPILSWKVADFFDKGKNDILLLSGARSRSRIRKLMRGFTVMEMANSPLSGIPVGVFTLKSRRDDEFHTHLLVSFSNATMLLAIGDRVEEVRDTGFLNDISTIHACLLGLDALAQVHGGGIHLVQADKTTSDWISQDGEVVIAAAHTTSQIAIYMSSGDIILFELDSQSGALMEMDRIGKVDITLGDLGATPCLSFSPCLAGQTRSSLLAVSDGSSKVVRIFSVERKGPPKSIAVQALPSTARSLTIIDATSSTGNFCLLVGTGDGLLLRAQLDVLSGQIRGKRVRYLGSGAVDVFRISASGVSCALALSSTPWICHPSPGEEMQLSPLVSETLKNADFFCSEQCPDGFVAVAGSTLRILTFEDPLVINASADDRASSASLFSYASTSCKYTPRKVDIIDQSLGIMVVASSDQAAQPVTTSADAEKALKVGLPTARLGEWASSLSLMSVERDNVSEEAETETLERSAATMLQEIHLSTNQTILALCVLSFFDKDPQEKYVCVSLATNLTVNGLLPQQPSSEPVQNEIRVYRLVRNGGDGLLLQIVHITPIDHSCNVLTDFHGRLMAGIGRSLTMFELGKKRLLKKAESRRAVPSRICTISVTGDRIFVGDVQDGFHLFRYKASLSRLLFVADEPSSRWMTCSTVVDYCTAVGGDKFGNVFLVRLPPELSNVAEEDPTAGVSRQGDQEDRHLLRVEACFHVGSMVHSVAKCSLGGTEESIVYSTISGSISALTPLLTRAEIDLLQKLEHQMRDKSVSLCGREHLAYRSKFYPARNVIDGDLCELYLSQPHEVQEEIAQELDHNISEVCRKLEDLRDRIL